MSAALAPSQPALTPPPAMLMPREDQPMGALLPEHLRAGSALASNVATVSAQCPMMPQIMSAPLPLMTPPPATVPEGTLSQQTQAVIEAHPLSQQMKQDAVRDEAIMATVRASLAHIFAGQSEMYLPAEERTRIVHEVMQQAHHFRETARSNPDLRIEHLEHMIGPASHFSKTKQHAVKMHHPHHNPDHLDHKASIMHHQLTPVANDPYAAQNVVLHPQHPDHPSHHLHAPTAEYHGPVAPVPQVGMASTGGGN